MKKEVSSGTEKAEELTRKKNSTKAKKDVSKAKKPAVKKTESGEKKVKAKKADHKKRIKHISEKKLKKREQREQKKLEAAKIKAEKKQKRLEKKLEHRQKRLDAIAAAKEKRAARKEARKERRDLLKHESKEARIQRKAEEKEARIQAKVAKREAAAAERQAKREHRLKVRAEKRAAKQEKRRTPGFGGWLAAVIALGVTTLALGTMLTFGWLNMNGMQAEMSAMHTESLYELNSVIDNLDTNLAKARVSSSAGDQVRILSDIAIQSEMAEVLLERMPVETRLTDNMTSFINKMSDSAKSMLFKAAKGEKLSPSEKASIEYMYKYNLEMKRIFNELTSTSSPEDMMDALKGKSDSLMLKSFGDIQNNSIEMPKEINDGPFADNVKKVSAKNLENEQEINATQAEELAAKYFGGYRLSGVECTGEAISDKIECYNLVLQTNDGDMFAQLSKKGGKVVMFDSYKECSDKNFSVDRCVDIATDFLNELGFNGMKAVWTSENGTTCNLNFAYEQDGVVFYPDMVKVKVCEERGIVTGLEGMAYVLNHTERTAGKATVSEKQAKSNLNPAFETELSRLTVIPFDGEEVLAYEFYGAYGGNDYYIYVDANTGNEIQVFTVIGTKQGKALM